ncbi:MAG: helicase HerA-like domain-containing protein, partial [Promethearchaeota archaeon]
MKFWIGYRFTPDGEVTDELVHLDANMLRRHLGTFGTTGSGKTVFCKIILEEAARHGIPIIALDPQGDLASLAIPGNPEELEKNGISRELQEEFKEKVAVRIFTPASSKGARISVNPLVMPSRKADTEDVIRIIDNSSRTLVRVLIKTAGLPGTHESRAFAVIFEILKYFWDRKREISNLSELADLVALTPEELGIPLDKYMKPSERLRLSHAIRSLTIGASQLLFSTGEPIDFSRIIEKVEGKTPLNIFFLKTLRSEEEKMFFVSILLSQMYSWMLQQGSSRTPRLVFFTDEIAPFVPAGTLKPGPKDTFLMLFRQARKYGIICMVATQSPRDLDYKAFDQFNTLGLGRIISPQSQKTIQHLLDQSIGEQNQAPLIDEISRLTLARFLVVNPTLPNNMIRVRTRWLLTQHLTLTEDDVQRLAQGKKILSFDMTPTPRPVLKGRTEQAPKTPSATEQQPKTKVPKATAKRQFKTPKAIPKQEPETPAPTVVSDAPVPEIAHETAEPKPRMLRESEIPKPTQDITVPTPVHETTEVGTTEIVTPQPTIKITTQEPRVEIEPPKTVEVTTPQPTIKITVEEPTVETTIATTPKTTTRTRRRTKPKTTTRTRRRTRRRATPKSTTRTTPEPKPRTTITTEPVPLSGSLTEEQELVRQIPTQLEDYDTLSHDDILNALLARLEKIARSKFGLPFLRELIKEKDMSYEKAKVYYINELRAAIEQGLAVTEGEAEERRLLYDFKRLFLALAKKLRVNPEKVNISHIKRRFEDIVERAKINSI